VNLVASAPLWNGRQLAGNWDVIWYYTLQHGRYAVAAVLLGLALALPLSYLAVRRPGVYPVLLAATNIVYAIPALTLFVMLGPWLGFTNDKPIVVAMTLYTLVILVRNIVEGIRAVPEPVLRAADAMGYRRLRRFGAVELPLALPGIIAGLRLATVSTVSLISVGAIIGRGGLGRMFADGYQRRINDELWSALVATMVLALLLDLIIYSAGRAATPWARRRGATT
jgi:osmoprotectant transport system permease protein